MTAACAVRGLALSRPVQVRPMTTFKGGYTAGIGSVTWEREYAEQWRTGWCALGVYCAEEAQAAAVGRNPDDGETTTPLNRPAGLYDPNKNTLFVRDMASAPTSTIAHETVHALQYQRYPRLHAIHLWHNRDLAAAANSAIEGDAHVVGWYFDLEHRLYLCSMDAQHAAANHRRWWRWTPTRLSAYESFPHVFGPELVLRRLLAADQDAIADLPRWLPLSTLQVLKPDAASEVDFIDLPPAIVSAALAEKGCKAGLANTAGTLGIWGLLRQHGALDAEPPHSTQPPRSTEPPALIENWRGDRFVHVACPGENDDELAWLTRWRTASAAADFAARYQRIAPAVAAHGEVLGGIPQAKAHGDVVVVTTPGLHDVEPALLEAPTRTFGSFRDWFLSGCFPQEKCGAAPVREPPAASEDFVCAKPNAVPAAFTQWLETVRRARAAPPVEAAETAAVVKAAAELATFCTVNTVGNSDVAQACRAAYSGISFQTQLLQDPNWRGLPHCGSQPDIRRLLRRIYFADSEDGRSATFANVYGAGLAAAAFASKGMGGLDDLASTPPLSTRQILWPQRQEAIEFLHFPPRELGALGCEVTASDVQGALAIWNLLDHDGAAAADPPPTMLGHWRGDLQVHLSCGTNAQGWIWAIRWASADAAKWFATRYNALPPSATKEAGLAALAETDGQTAWMAPPSLAAATTFLKGNIRTRHYRTFQEWRREGCFPQEGCN